MKWKPLFNKRVVLIKVYYHSGQIRTLITKGKRELIKTTKKLNSNKRVKAWETSLKIGD